MRFRPLLVNPPWEDPGVFVELVGTGEAWLLDCGGLALVRGRDLLRVSRVFLSHAHIDHFIGFDHLLRFRLGSQEAITVYGPAGVTGHVRGKLAGYVWNLVEESSLEIRVAELADRRVEWTCFPCRDRFQGRSEGGADHQGALDLPGGGRVRFAPVEHGVECLAYVLEEPPVHSVDPACLREVGAPPGRWVAELKELVALGARTGELEVGGRSVPVAELADRLVRSRPGRRVAYVTDTVFNKRSVAALKGIARGADELWCEAAYLHEERDKAREFLHMTARQAGRLAAELEVGRLHLFHFSRRYRNESGPHLEEARQVFPRVEEAPRYG